MAGKQIKDSVIRILKDEELSGYSIYKMLALKGVESWPNHIYTLLIEMEKDGLLKSRWAGNRRGVDGKHLYSLSKSGKERYEGIVRESLGVLMERFFNENLSFEDLAFHIGLAKETFGSPARWSESEPFKLVVASPTYHPLICFPKFYYALSEGYPRSSIYVVKNPWEKPLEGRKNLTYLDGSRDEIPLRDGYADYILLQGFPRSSSVAETVGECLRVLKDDGCLFVEVPSVMTAEKRTPTNTVFPEYVLKLFYELCGEDRIVSIEEVDKALLASFGRVRNREVRGKLIFHATGKKAEVPAYARASRARSATTARG